MHRSPIPHVQALILALYLLISALALFVTFTHTMTPLWPAVRFSYGMMAPFQGYLGENQSLGIKVQKSNGNWKDYEFAPILGFSKGQTAVRGFLPSFRDGPEEVLQEKYALFAQQLLDEINMREEITYIAIKLNWESWPKSADGFESKREKGLMTRTTITTWPKN